MTRPDGCFRWVIEREGDDPVIARWDARDDQWTFPEAECDGVHWEYRVHKVGIGGSVDQSPTEWEDDIPPTHPKHTVPTEHQAMMSALIQPIVMEIANDLLRPNPILEAMTRGKPLVMRKYQGGT